MNIFNSLGSNYTFIFAMQARFTRDNPDDLKRLTEYIGQKYQGKAFLTYKGRDAIFFALKAAKLPKGSLIGINGFTCFAVYKAVVDAGHRPMLLDIERNTLHFSSKKLDKKLKAVIVQNTLGIPCEIEAIAAFCKKNDIMLIEDLAHSVGTTYQNLKEAGSVGDFIALSFSQDKAIDTVSGGALVICNKKYQDFKMPHLEKQSLWGQLKDRLYPTHTWEVRKLYPFLAGKLLHQFLKMIDILPKPVETEQKRFEIRGWQAKLALEQFSNLAISHNHRLKIAKIYADTLDLPIIPGSAYLRFPLFVKNRDKLVDFLKTKGVYISDIWYDAPIAPKRYMSQIDYKETCPIAEKAAQEIINLPTHKNVSEEDAKQICEWINEFSNTSHSERSEESLANASF
jgi:dTDP-4-amino-4,6-dideoxygalactose transaminase